MAIGKIGGIWLAKKRISLMAVPLILIGGVGIWLWHSLSHTSKVVQTETTNLTPAEFQAETTQLKKLLDQSGAEAALAYVNQKIAADPTYARQCHPLLHELGEAAYGHYGDYQKAIAHQSEICDSGYTHGVLEAYFKQQPDLQLAMTQACQAVDNDQQPFQRWQCFHGMGHGIMLVNKKDVAKSVPLCQSLPDVGAQSACINGVFMEHFVVQAHDGTIPTTNPTSLADCEQPAATGYKNDCYLYAPTAYLRINYDAYQSAMTWCHGAEPHYIVVCISGIGSQAMKDNINKPSAVLAACQLAEKAWQSACIEGAVATFIYFDGATAPAQKLCDGVFSAYKAACQSQVVALKASLQI